MLECKRKSKDSKSEDDVILDGTCGLTNQAALKEKYRRKEGQDVAGNRLKIEE